MSNTDAAPAEVACAASPFAGVLHAREVPLGGPRAIRVRRTLPQRERSLIGAWCFADHYGPHDVRSGPVPHSRGLVCIFYAERDYARTHDKCERQR